jgi:hypothetical protein
MEERCLTGGVATLYVVVVVTVGANMLVVVVVVVTGIMNAVIMQSAVTPDR